MKALSLYIHIPFCVSKCAYCAFVSSPPKGDCIDRYFKALSRETDILKALNKDYYIDTIFIGGGTPTSVDEGCLFDVINRVKDNIETHIIEFTVEGNPDSFSLKKADTYLKMGATRFSIGVQSLNDKTLKTINRAHSSAQAIDAITTLKSTGADISADYMVGLPYQTLADLSYEVNTLLDCNLNHLSCYSLILEEDTPIYTVVNSGNLILPTEDDTVNMYDEVYKICSERGLERYEISNFGKPCIHNMRYWHMNDYLGLGVAAHSLIDNVRLYNTQNTDEYIADYSDSKLSVTKRVEEILSISDAASEYIFLSLRTDEGVIKDEFISYYGEALYTKALIKAYDNESYLTIDDRGFRIKKEYFYISNSVICEFTDLK